MRRRTYAPVVMSLAFLAGCSGAEAPPETEVEVSPPPTTADARASDGQRVARPEYSYRAPRGWDGAPPGAEPGTGHTAQLDSQVWRVVDARLVDGVSVVRIDAVVSRDLSTVEDTMVAALRAEGGASEIEVLPRLDVDGSPATAVRALKAPSDGGAALPLLQYAMVHGGRTYVVSFAFTTGEADEQDLTARSVLASWDWTR